MTATMPQRYLLHAVLVLVSSSVAFACQGQLVSGLSVGEKEIILHEHNKLRQVVATGRYPGQPGAANMREIVWDDELAARAQQWADNCQFRHDPHRTINRFTMGQNLAIIWSTAPLDATDGDFPSRIQSWFNEVQKYSFGDAWSPKTGHYSQLVWGETSLVGCGFSEYKDTTKYNKLYVCNYGPGGNVVGFNPYAVGKPSCGSYGLRTSSRYQGLCAPSSAPVVGITANTIDTYEYKQTNTKHTAYSTTQPAPSPSYPKQASTYTATQAAASSSGSTTYTAQAGHAYKYKNKLEAYRPSPAEFQKSVRKHTILRTYIGAHNQNENQNQNQNQNQNYNENQNQYQYQQPQQQQPQQPQQEQVQATVSGDRDASAPEIYVFEEPKQNADTTSQSAKRGWSLLTWRG